VAGIRNLERLGPRDRVPVDHCDRVLAPLTMALAVRRDLSWRPITVVSLAAGALFIVFLILPWGNASFLMAIVTLFGWIAALAARLGTHHS
jgi:hypothetical protein